MKRIASIDIVRGLVMVIMVLDHTRDFLHITALTQSPTDLQTTTGAIFLTRWITHLCAPIFVFLSGASAYISLAKSSDVAESRKFLLKRGLWLIFLEFTIINFGIWFDIYFHVVMQQVICAIGFGLISLSIISCLPSRWIAVVGISIVAGHNLLPGAQPGVPFIFGIIPAEVWAIFLRVKLIAITPNFSFLVAYPLIPWLGIMLCGFACGRIFERPTEERRKIFVRFGIGLIVLFALLRFVNMYGDPAPWHIQSSPLFTALSFINVTKSPPSLLFTSAMLGIMFLLLAAAEERKIRATNILAVYGSVPLFYYVLHWYVLRIVVLAIIVARGYSLTDIRFEMMAFGLPKNWIGLELPAVYFFWMVVVVMLYPLCRWYGRYKQNHRKNILVRYI